MLPNQAIQAIVRPSDSAHVARILPQHLFHSYSRPYPAGLRHAHFSLFTRNSFSGPV